MDLSGEFRIGAPRDIVWAALNDPEVLRASIPGCEDLHQVTENEFTAKAVAKVGAIQARLVGKITLSDISPPESYVITGQGQGGTAGFAKGQARVQLVEDGNETLLRYEGKADVGGKLASVGNRLIQGVATRAADDFFRNFEAIVTAREPAVPKVAPTEAPATSAPGRVRLTWLLAGIIVVAVIAVAIFSLR